MQKEEDGRTAYINNWKRKNIIRIAVETRKPEADKIKIHAKRNGQSVNAYILEAVRLRMKQEDNGSQH